MHQRPSDPCKKPRLRNALGGARGNCTRSEAVSERERFLRPAMELPSPNSARLLRTNMRLRPDDDHPLPTDGVPNVPPFRPERSSVQ